MKRGLKIALMAVLGITAFLLFILGVQYLWNWLVPDIFGWTTITYWQAMGLFILSKILFKGFTWHGGRGRWGSHWKSKWQTMSPEEGEKFKQKMREKCGWIGPRESANTNTP